MARIRRRALPASWTFGYLPPPRGVDDQELCNHTPPCFVGDLSRCKPQPKQALAHASPAEILFYGGAVGGGKALDENTPIPTPDGYRRLGDLHVGDFVLDETGQACRVWNIVGVDEDCYRVIFDDGSEIIAGARHLWHTFTVREREQAARRTARFRSARRQRRPHRGTGKRPDLARRNAERPPKVLPPPSGGVRDTHTIAATLRARHGRIANHAIPVAGPWDLPERDDLPIDPYVLGVWLGDGRAQSAGLTSADPEVIACVREAGFPVSAMPSERFGWWVKGLHQLLRSSGLLRHKHIPAVYFSGSHPQRLALLQGLMDTDGCCNRDGQADFTNTNPDLATGVFRLAVSLGLKPTITEGRAKLRGKDCGPKWTVRWTDTLAVFRLPRKAERLKTRLRGCQRWRTIVACEPVARRPLRCISVDSPSRLFLCGEAAIPTHNSEYDLVEAIAICLEHRNVKVGIFRRKLKELREEIVGRFMLHVPEFIATYNGQDMCARFFNGSELWFCHVQHEKDVYGYKGIQFVAIFFDEASEATEFIIRYLITRVRSVRIGMRKRIRLTSNPGGPGHGFLKRWFLRPVPDELGGRPNPRPFEIWRPLPLATDPTPPERVPTRQFIPAWFKDNIALATADPDYLAKVYQLGGDKGRQLAEGDWDANEMMIVGADWREAHEVGETDYALRAAFPHLKLGTRIAWHVLDNRAWRPPKGSLIYGSLDYGYGAPAAIHLHAALADGHTRTFLEFYGPRKRDSQQAQILKTFLERDTFDDGRTKLMEGLQWVVYDPQMSGSRKEVGLAKSIIEVFQDAMPRVQFLSGAAGRQARLSRPQRWLDAIAPAPDGLPWWSCTTRCQDLIRTVPEVPWDDDDPDVEDEDSENHAYEGVGRFFEARPHAPRTALIDPYANLDALSRAHHQALDESVKGGSDIPQLYVHL